MSAYTLSPMPISRLLIYDRIPRSILLGVGHIHLVDGQGAFGGGIHAGIFRLSCGNADGEAENQRQGEDQGDHFLKMKKAGILMASHHKNPGRFPNDKFLKTL